MRTPREIRADLDAVNEEIEATKADFRVAHDADEQEYARFGVTQLAHKRRRLEAELAGARAADALTPELFADPSLANALTTAKAMDRIMEQGFPSLFGGKR